MLSPRHAVAAALGGAGLVLALTACGVSSTTASDGPPGTKPPPPPPPATAAVATVDETGCEAVDAPAPKADPGPGAPTGTLDATRTWTATVATSCGTFVITLDVKDSPNTTASFASLARAGFLDGTVFHRIVPGFVIQGGDPRGDGTGGASYSVVDAPPAGARYVHGVAAMAKTPQDPPGTSGSQFFVVTAPDAGLPPEYALLGTVTQGLDVVDRIGVLGDPSSGGAGTPTHVVVIERVTIASS